MAVANAPLTPEELAIWASVASLLERLPAALDAQLQRDSGITHFEQGILQALDLAPDRTLRLSVIADYASCTLSRLSRAITRLEARGWVRREVDPDDGRYTRGILTPAGHAKVADSTPGHQELVRRLVFDALTPAQARQLGALSRRIATAVGPGAPWNPAHA